MAATIKKMKNSKICQTKFHQNYNNLWESHTHLKKGKIFTEQKNVGNGSIIQRSNFAKESPDIKANLKY